VRIVLFLGFFGVVRVVENWFEMSECSLVILVLVWLIPIIVEETTANLAYFTQLFISVPSEHFERWIFGDECGIIFHIVVGDGIRVKRCTVGKSLENWFH
jgi:hypothetical protein